MKYFGAGLQPTPPAPSASATVDDDTAGRFTTIQDQYIFILINHDYFEICFVLTMALSSNMTSNMASFYSYFNYYR